MDAIMYKSEDTDAPILTGLAGSLIDVLTKVLVTGYGTMPSLGWTKEFEDVGNNVAVFRMPSGSRTFIRIDDNYALHVTRSALITAYESMSSVDIGIHPCPDPIETYRVIPKSATTDSVARGWRIIGDDKGFYFLPLVYGFPNVLSGINRELQYFFLYYGDYTNLNPSDPAVYCCICASTYNKPYIQCTSITNVSAGFWRMRDSDNEIGYTSIGLGSGFYGSTTLLGNGIAMSPLGGKNLHTRTFIHKNNVILGSLPGLLNWLGKYSSGDDDEIREYYENEGADEVAFSMTSYTTTFAVATNPASCQRITIKLGSRFRDA